MWGNILDRTLPTLKVFLWNELFMQKVFSPLDKSWNLSSNRWIFVTKNHRIIYNLVLKVTFWFFIFCRNLSTVRHVGYKGETCLKWLPSTSIFKTILKHWIIGLTLIFWKRIWKLCKSGSVSYDLLRGTLCFN